MKRIHDKLLLAVASLSGAAALGEPVGNQGAIGTEGIAHIRRHRVTWDTPGKAAYDAMPLGNGSMGMLVSVTEDGVLFGVRTIAVLILKGAQDVVLNACIEIPASQLLDALCGYDL